MTSTLEALGERHNAHIAVVDARYAQSMDVLSDAVAAMRTGRPHSNLITHAGRYRGEFPSTEGAGFHVVLEGSCALTVAAGSEIILRPGDVAFLPWGAAHGLSGSGMVLLCGAYLHDRSRTHPLLADLPEVVHLPAGIGRRTGLRAAIDLLGAELQDSQPGSARMIPALLEVLLLQILRTWSAEADTGWATALRDPAVAAALRAIHNDVARPWTVVELAASAGLSRAALARRFQALTGMAPMSYLTWWRMTVAAGLLRDSDLPLAGVARRVGYASEYAFAHAFKRVRGQPPGAYRLRRG
jgi:AraC-like DNA-binding protein/mannose-6-phosphate isomerase-like protein (cupin superfamily)